MPEVYLRGFADARGLITMADVAGAPPITTNVRNVAVEGNFYTIEIDNQPSDRLEQRHLARIEGIIAKALRGLDHGWPPVGILREGLANLLALQMVRGKEFRAVQAHLVDQFHKHRFQSISREDLRRTLEEADGVPPGEGELADLEDFIRKGEFTVETSQSLYAVTMLDAGSTAYESVNDMRWDLLEIAPGEDVDFVTCDEPVVRWREHPSASMAYFKMGVMGAQEITFPIDRRRMILIRPTAGGAGMKRFIDGGAAGELNRRTVANARRYFYFHPDARPHPYAERQPRTA